MPVSALARTAARARPHPAYFVLAVPTPANAGAGDPREHLLAGRLPADASAALADEAAGAGPLFEPTPVALPPDTLVEWCGVSDERPEVARRRDSTRPVAAYAGTHVELWGCGALGSWMAEHLVRAGVRRVVLRDPGRVTGGLLVRQDYAEDDVERPKAEALASRLRSISDSVLVEPHAENALLVLHDDGMPECDLLIDATVSTATYVGIDLAWAKSKQRPVVARVSTDTPTATMALLTVCHPDWQQPPSSLDDLARMAVSADSELERFSVFWEDVPSRELTPAPGCSVPTFHGAAADVAAVSGVIVTQLAPHLRAGGSGSHLAALPTAPGTGPATRWLPARS